MFLLVICWDLRQREISSRRSLVHDGLGFRKSRATLHKRRSEGINMHERVRHETGSRQGWWIITLFSCKLRRSTYYSNRSIYLFLLSFQWYFPSTSCLGQTSPKDGIHMPAPCTSSKPFQCNPAGDAAQGLAQDAYQMHGCHNLKVTYACASMQVLHYTCMVCTPAFSLRATKLKCMDHLKNK